GLRGLRDDRPPGREWTAPGDPDARAPDRVHLRPRRRPVGDHGRDRGRLQEPLPEELTHRGLASAGPRFGCYPSTTCSAASASIPPPGPSSSSTACTLVRSEEHTH